MPLGLRSCMVDHLKAAAVAAAATAAAIGNRAVVSNDRFRALHATRHKHGVYSSSSSNSSSGRQQLQRS
jgi:hypothetical protein